jgi:hypothetical protein
MVRRSVLSRRWLPRLIGSPHAAVPRAQPFDLSEFCLELRAVQARRSLSFVAIVEPNHKRVHGAPMRQDRLHRVWRGQLIRAWPIFQLDVYLLRGSVRGTQFQQLFGHHLPKLHAVRLWRSFGNPRQGGFIGGVDRSGLPRREAS